MLMVKTDLAARKFLTLSYTLQKKEQVRKARPSGQKQVIPAVRADLPERRC